MTEELKLRPASELLPLASGKLVKVDYERLDRWREVMADLWLAYFGRPENWEDSGFEYKRAAVLDIEKAVLKAWRKAKAVAEREAAGK